jgi:hypothetical protein
MHGITLFVHTFTRTHSHSPTLALWQVVGVDGVALIHTLTRSHTQVVSVDGVALIQERLLDSESPNTFYRVW